MAGRSLTEHMKKTLKDLIVFCTVTTEYKIVCSVMEKLPCIILVFHTEMKEATECFNEEGSANCSLASSA